MSDTLEKLQRELQAAQRTIAKLQDKLESRETTHRLTTLELEENRSALLFMLEDLEAARRKIEQAHQEWMAALDVVDDPIFLHDKEFRILRCNKAYQQRAGIPFHEIIGQPYYEVFPKTGAPLPCCLRAMEKAEEEEEEEVTAGEAIYRSRAVSIRDEQGAYLYSVHTLEDITERKRIESDLGVYQAELKMQNETLRNARNDLEESRDQFVDLYEFSPVGYFTLNREEKIDKINLTGATLLGAERNKLLHHRFAPFVATEDSDRWHRHFFSVLQHDGQQRCELALRRSDGSVFHAQLDCLHMRADGASSVRVALVDITERRRAEQALRESEKLYRSLFENMLNGFAYCRMIFEQDQPQDFIYLNVNTAFEALTGLKDVVGRKASEVIPGIRQSDPGLFEIYGRASLSGKPERFEIYVEALRQWFWISVYSPEKGYFVAVFDVITERKLAEAKLAEQVDDLRRWHDATIGREMRVLDLKHEVNELLGQAGQPPRYPSAKSDDPQEK